jgi:hypothetical protein
MSGAARASAAGGVGAVRVSRVVEFSFDIKGEVAGGMARNGDDATVARKLQDLVRELTKTHSSIFPGDAANAHSEDERVRKNYAERCLFLKLVNQCHDLMWGVSRNGMSVRCQRPWGETVNMLKDEMQEKLREACYLSCSTLWYCEDIHNIRQLVYDILKGQEEAEAKKKASEAAAAAQVNAKVRASREVEAFGTLTTVTTVAVVAGKEALEKPPAVEVLKEERKEALRKVVRDMRMNLFTLQATATIFDKDSLYFINTVFFYQESCCDTENKTWVWNASAWDQASLYLRSCVNGWTRESKLHDRDRDHWFYRLKKEGEKCQGDMKRYKQICENGWTERAMRSLHLRCKLDALKELA